MKQVQELLGPNTLTGGSFSYLFLILQFILTDAPHFPLPLKEIALSLTVAHASLSSKGNQKNPSRYLFIIALMLFFAKQKKTGLPRPSMASTLVHTLGSASSDFQTKSKGALLTLSKFIEIPEGLQDQVLSGNPFKFQSNH